jgi:small-conductance mechanosensitive channel
MLAPLGAQRLALGLTLLGTISLIALPPILALGDLGYDNPGAVEGLWIFYKFLVGLVFVVVLLRRRFLLSLVPAQSGRGGRLATAAVGYLQPIAILLVPVLLVLDALRYDILARLITRFSIAALVALIFGGVIYRACRSVADAWLDRNFKEATAPRRTAATSILHYMLGVGFLLFAVWGFLRLSGSDLDELKSFFDTPLPLQSGGANPITWWKVIVAVFLLAVLLRGVGPARRSLRELVLTRTKLDEGLRYTIATLFGYVLFASSIYIALQQIVDLSSLGYLVAALGVGFGLQEIVSNFVSGLILLFERPLKVGDLIQVGDKQGIVRRINIRATTVLTQDNVYLLVPNRELIAQTVVNFAHEDPRMRIHVAVGVSYASDTAKVRDVLLAVAKEHDSVLDHPLPRVRFCGFGDSSLDFELLAWIQRPAQQHDIGSDLCFAIFQAFLENDIEIPFPQRDLHVRSIVPGALAAAQDPPEESPS